MNRLGLLDIFLSVIAKSLQLQVKIKSTNLATSATNKQPFSLQLYNCIDFGISNLQAQDRDPLGKVAKTNSGTDTAEKSDFEFIPKKFESQNLNQRWFLRGTIHIKQAENIIILIRDMASVSICAVCMSDVNVNFRVLLNRLFIFLCRENYPINGRW